MELEITYRAYVKQLNDKFYGFFEIKIPGEEPATAKRKKGFDTYEAAMNDLINHVEASVREIIESYELIVPTLDTMH